MINDKKELIAQFLKFNMVGIINTLLTYLVFSGVYFLTQSNLLSLIFDYGIGILFSFFANRHFTFKAGKQDFLKQFAKMVGTYFILFLVNYALLWFMTEKKEMNPYLSQFGALIVITFLSFINQRFFVFKRKNSLLE